MDSPHWRPARYDGEPGILCVHGLTANPAEFDAISPYLRGSLHFSVLNGHCETPEALLVATKEGWYETVKNDYLAMREQHKNVLLMGMSTGALLTTALAAELSREDEPLDGLVSIAAPLYLRNRAHLLAPFLGPFDKKIVKMNSEHPERNYTKMPIHALRELIAGAKHVMQTAQEITVPTLIVASRYDPTVLEPKSSQTLLDKIPDAELLEFGVRDLSWFTSDYHNIVSPPDNSTTTPEIIAAAIMKKWAHLYTKAA